MRIRTILLFTCLIWPIGVGSALADATAFVGVNTTPSNRVVRGGALGVSLLIVGFEFEFAIASEDEPQLAPRLTTGMGNVYVQTPFPLAGLQPYVTAGAGAYRERLGAHSETNVGVNVGGGVRMSLLGPLRLRLDYRVFTLRGQPLHDRPQRIYLGLNLLF